MAKTLITLGVVLVIIGLLWPWIQKLNLGRLPGDVVVQKENFSFYFPIVSSLVISIVLTLLFWFFRK